MPGPRVRSPRGLGAATSPLPTSPRGSRVAERLPTWYSGFRKRTPGSRPPPQQQPGLAAESGSASRTESWGILPRQQGPRVPLCSAHRTHLCQRRGRWRVPRAYTHPQHRLSGRGRLSPTPLFAWALCFCAGLQGGGLLAAGGAADGSQAESPAAPAPGVPSGASQGSGLRGEGVPTPLAAQRRGPSPPPPPRHSPCLFLPDIPLLPLAASVIPPSDLCPGWSPESPHASQEPWMAGTGLSTSVQRMVWSPGVGCWLCGRHRTGVQGRWAGRNPGRGWPWPDPTGPVVGRRGRGTPPGATGHSVLAAAEKDRLGSGQLAGLWAPCSRDTAALGAPARSA